MEDYELESLKLKEKQKIESNKWKKNRKYYRIAEIICYIIAIIAWIILTNSQGQRDKSLAERIKILENRLNNANIK